MSSRRWANVSYLDAIRPEPAWRTDYAFLASYSADLVAMVAALLSLAGLDDDRGSGSKVDLANAVDQLADRVRLVVQAGRLVAPAKTPRILTILDRYVREVQLDETTASWHPKAVLAKHVQQDAEGKEWRLWIGSRNLTRDLAWDVGLTLIGRSDGQGSDVPGLSDLAAALAEQAALPGISPQTIRRELQQVRWVVPAGCSINSLRLLNETSPRGLPPAPNRVDRLVVISPFLDGTIVRALGKWGTAETPRIIVSTRSELAKLASQTGEPLAAYSELLFLDAPTPDEQVAGDVSDRENANSEDEKPEPRTLHAKVVFAQSGVRRLLWTGSANATQRGWNGPNREVVAELEVSPEVANGLESFVTEIAKTVRFEELGDPDEPDTTEERLETARKHVAAAWDVKQQLVDLAPCLMAAVDPNPPDAEITLSVGLLAGNAVVWTRGATSIQLPAVSPADVTELVWCRLSLEDSSICWLQRAPLDPAPDDDRDRQALARYLDPRTFLQWIRSLLTGESDGEGGGDWDGESRTPPRRGKLDVVPTWWAPTMEEVLRAWSRDPNSLKLIDRKVRHFLKLYQEQTESEVSAEDRAIVAEFHQTWQILRRELVEGS